MSFSWQNIRGLQLLWVACRARNELFILQISRIQKYLIQRFISLKIISANLKKKKREEPQLSYTM